MLDMIELFVMNISDILELFVMNMLAIPVLFPTAHDLTNISFRHVQIRDPTEMHVPPSN